MTVVGEWIYCSFFLPSEPFNAQMVAAYNATTVPSAPIEVAGEPAEAGTFLTCIRFTDIFPSAPTHT